jgi:hypothetical protein
MEWPMGTKSRERQTNAGSSEPPGVTTQRDEVHELRNVDEDSSSHSDPRQGQVANIWLVLGTIASIFLVLGTWALVVITLVSAWTTTSIQRETANIQRHQVDLQREATYMELRAYLAVRRPVVRGARSPAVSPFIRGEKAQMILPVVNTGKTTAYNVKLAVVLQIVDSSAQMPNPNSIPIQVDRVWSIEAGEIEQIPVPSGYVVPLDYTSDKYRVFIYGRFDYEDVYRKPHFKTFLFQYIYAWGGLVLLKTDTDFTLKRED